MVIQENLNIEKSREISQKFEFYLLALVFSILGFSVQTSVFTTNCFQIALEILALISLLLSGLAGLSRIESLSSAFLVMGLKQENEIKLNQIKQGLNEQPIPKQSGGFFKKEELEIAENKLQTTISKNIIQYNKFAKLTIDKFKIHKYSFIFGMLCLLLSRISYNLILL